MWISSWAFRLGYFQIIHFFKYYRCTWKMNWNSRRYDNNRFDSFFTLKMFIFIVSCWTEPSGSDYISWRFCRFGVSCLFCCTEYFHKNQSTLRLFGRRNCINFHQIRYMLRKMKSYICDFEIVSNNLIKSFFFAVFLATSNYYGILAVIAVLGFIRTWLHVPLVLIFAEYLPTER